LAIYMKGLQVTDVGEEEIGEFEELNVEFAD
jgi:hypothetical protein